MPDLPRGTVTFLFTDVEGSTALWQRYPDEMAAVYGWHDALLRGAAEERGGVAYKTIGDAFQVAFPSAPAAVGAALEIQRELAAETWGPIGTLRVRMALHTAAVDPGPDGDYRAPALNRLGRLLGAGHGGQVLLSLPTHELVRDHLPAGAAMRDLGEQRLKDLYRPERVFQILHPGLPAEFPALKTLDARPNNLPSQPTQLVGREREAGQVAELLGRDEVRLVTLSGPGGTGKTRLGLQVAADLLDAFADGVFFVPLAAIADPELVAGAVAGVLGAREEGGASAREAVREHLRDKWLLLVLDNVEQVVEAAPLVGELLAACRGLKVLATSRIRLQLRGERDYPVPPLGLPDPKRLPPIERLGQYEAVRLFVERARELAPAFAVTNDNAPAVAEICVRLDGLPLAIELAAARVRLLPPQAMLKRLAQRLPLLTGGARDLPERQRTLRGAIAWSHELLRPDEQKLFRRLAVFAGGWTLDAAEAVAGSPGSGELGLDVLEGLGLLVDHSLVRQEEAAGEARFGMLETIREYGLERLEASGEAEEARERHAGFFLALAEEAEPALRGPTQAAWLDRLETEHDNLRAVLAWTEAQAEGEAGLHLTGALGPFWLTRGHLEEGSRWLERALDGEGGEPSIARAGALRRLSLLVASRGGINRATRLLEESLTIACGLGDRPGEAAALHGLAMCAVERGDPARAAPLAEQSLDLFRNLGDRAGEALALQSLAFAAIDLGDPERGAALLEETLAIARELGDAVGVSMGLNNLGYLAASRGDHAQAAPLLEEALALVREAGDVQGIATTLHSLGGVAHARDDDARAAAFFREGLAVARDAGFVPNVAECLRGVAEVTAAGGNPEEAARLLGAEEALRDRGGASLPAAEAEPHLRMVEALRDAMGDAPFAAAWAAGRALPMEDAVAEALGVGGAADEAPGEGA